MAAEPQCLRIGPLILGGVLPQRSEFIVKFDTDDEHWALDTQRPHQYQLILRGLVDHGKDAQRAEPQASAQSQLECSICMAPFASMSDATGVYRLSCGQ
jgi:hypothetical protein